MNQLDILYRALVDYRKNTREDRECMVQRSAIITSNSEADVIEITRRTCKIEEDWVVTIERGLEFVEKAIKEERQFIRSNGEVIPIEKVKRVSKDSVEHLAKHSSLITREPEEGEDVVPDQLYTVERLSDYAVYENRFLYMLLCYLRDFIGMRYERILELTNTYNGTMTMNKTVVESNRRVEYQVTLKEEKKNDEYLKEHNEAQDVIDRMLVIYRAVVFFLNTPLMIEVAKAPMLKPPITRTNVLRMNRNFREALSLYEYVSAYDKDGYEIITEVKTLSPFVGIVADEIAETVEMSSFLTYEHGLGIKEYFRRRYEREEEKRKEEERKKLAEQIKNVRRHLKDGEISPEEYIVMLEKRISDLEEGVEELTNARTLIDELYKESDKLKFDLKHAKEKIVRLEDKIEELIQKHEEEMEAERIRHAEEVTAINLAHEQQVQAINLAHEEEIVAINTAHEEEIIAINTAHEEEIAEINDAHAREIEEINDAHEQHISILTATHEEEIARINQAHESEVERITTKYTNEIESITAEANRVQTILNSELSITKIELSEEKQKLEASDKECNRLNLLSMKLSDQKVLSDARLYAIRSEYGLIKEDEDLTNKEVIDELENQYYVFRKFFKTEWKQAKKRIRKEVFTQVNNEEEQRKIEKLKAKGKYVEPEKEQTIQTVTTVEEPEIIRAVEEEAIAIEEPLVDAVVGDVPEIAEDVIVETEENTEEKQEL